MSHPIRMCLYNPDPKAPMREALLGLNNALVLGQYTTRREIVESVRCANLDMVVVNLDTPNGLEIVERISAIAPRCGLIGISKRTEPSAIIGAMRAGCSQFVTWPVDMEDLRSAVDRIRSARALAFRTSKRICVVGSSGGAGATTVSCNLAIELGHLVDSQIGLVDLNLEFGDVACFFDSAPHYSVADVCKDDVEIDNVIVGKAFQELACKVSILARPEALDDATLVTADGVKAMLELAAEAFPFVVVDLPRYFDPVTAAALKDANRVLIVTQLGVSFIRNATRIYEILTRLEVPEDNIGIVINRYKAEHAQVKPENVADHFGKPPIAMIPNDYEGVQTSLDLGHAIMAEHPNSPARLAILELAKLLTGTSDVQTSGQSKGFLHRLLNRMQPVHTTSSD